MKSDCLTLKSLMFAAVLALAACGTEDVPLPDSGSDTGSDSGTDSVEADVDEDTDVDASGDACMSDSCGTLCDGVDPSQTCQVNGCPGDSVCAPVEGCVPSSCGCDETTGAWTCTDDCGQNYACVEAAAECPAIAPDTPSACSDEQEGLSCTWGQECCCGECFPSFGCNCTDGDWQCYATDACFIESCEGNTCETDADCEGGEGALSCVDGLCAAQQSTALDCANIEGQPSCDERAGCEWIEPPGCGAGEGSQPLPAAGCFVETRCASNEDCGAAEYCAAVTVAPRCMWEEPLCDACLEERGLCLPRER